MALESLRSSDPQKQKANEAVILRLNDHAENQSLCAFLFRQSGMD